MSTSRIVLPHAFEKDYAEIYKNNEDSILNGVKNISLSRFKEIFKQEVELKNKRLGQTTVINVQSLKLTYTTKTIS